MKGIATESEIQFNGSSYLDQDNALTTILIADVAEVCNVSYSQVLNHINHCRSQSDIEENLQQLIIRYRPDINI